MSTNFHSIDVLDLSRAEMEARKRMPIIYNYLKKYIPGFENAQLISSHSIIGIRESRRIIGDYVLNSEDVIQGKCFDDGVAIASWGPSLGHNPKGKLYEMCIRDRVMTPVVPERVGCPGALQKIY